MTFRFHWRAAVAALSVCLSTTAAQAAVVLSGTRVIYPAAQREVTLKLTNEGHDPVLVQSWIDDGDPHATPDQVQVPFTLTPPLFRLDPARGQTVRIIYTQDPLPQDQESLFWLNALEVPPRVDASKRAANSLQLAVRTRIKLFFRPTGLTGSANDAASKAQWRFVKKASGEYALAIVNPTPYHITFSKVHVRTAGKEYMNEEGTMVPPKSTIELNVGHVTVVTGESPTDVHYTSINDYGAAVIGAWSAGAR